ncbi:MAG TPA: iron-sulfur cluster assembly accessory protein, partial [Gallionella sp.]|nr:iron-sulfur cluster assembly accessory protein [Gallionella sp.]
MAVTLTESAAKHVRKFIEKRGKGVGLRLAVKTSGCSGFSYAIEFADVTAPDDMLFESYGVTVLIDPKSHTFLAGTELDFVR